MLYSPPRGVSSDHVSAWTHVRTHLSHYLADHYSLHFGVAVTPSSAVCSARAPCCSCTANAASGLLTEEDLCPTHTPFGVDPERQAEPVGADLPFELTE